MAKSLILLGFTLPLLGCGTELAMKSIDDGPGGATRSYAVVGPIHSPGGWKKTVQLYVADDAPEIVVEATVAVARTWNEAIGTEILAYEGRRSPVNRGSLFSVLEDDISMIYYERNWSKTTGKADYVLGTTVWENSGPGNEVIYRGDIILNGENFYLQDALGDVEVEERVFDIVDAESVLLHEVGHLLGLDHVDEQVDPNSVMLPTTPVGWQVAKREISQGDHELINQIYSGGN